MNTFTQTRPGIKIFLTGALIAGIISALLNNLYSVIYTAVTGFSIREVIHVGSVTGASVIPALIGGLIYFGLSRITPKATLIFIVLGIAFTLFSFMGPFQPQLPDGTPTPEGFVGLTLPMHLISGGVILYVLTQYVQKGKIL
jgi:hypothetical protein